MAPVCRKVSHDMVKLKMLQEQNFPLIDVKMFDSKPNLQQKMHDFNTYAFNVRSMLQFKHAQSVQVKNTSFHFFSLFTYSPLSNWYDGMKQMTETVESYEHSIQFEVFFSFLLERVLEEYST